LGDPIIYIHTKFGEDIFIGGEKFEKRSLAAKFTSGSNFKTLRFLGICVYVIMQNFSEIGQSPSAILDIRGWRTLTIPRVAASHFLRRHQIW